MVMYRTGPRELDEWYLGELVDAYYMLPIHRKEKIRDLATAVLMARQVRKKSDWQRTMRELET